MSDVWYNRIGLQIGLRFDLTPNDEITGWRKWAFDPFFGVTIPGQVLDNPRSQLPKIQHYVDNVGEGKDENGMKIWKWVSRAFWFRAGIRFLGIDIGIGIIWRKKAALKGNQ